MSTVTHTSPLFVSFENNSLSNLYKLETLALPLSPDKEKLARLCCMSTAIFPFMDSGRSSPRAKIASISSSVIIDPRALKILSAPKLRHVLDMSLEPLVRRHHLFQLYARNHATFHIPERPGFDIQWGLTVKEDRHNPAPSIEISGHPSNRRLSQEAAQKVKQLASAGVAPAKFYQLYPLLFAISKTVCNGKAKQQLEVLDGRSPIQEFLDEFQGATTSSMSNENRVGKCGDCS
ncbi:hypothetical protein PsorP6_002226 [Peronosclerospora sorghi]|uniref:Uncharacterized protein n=1 Tax=Peronosclerospora sorghi TaxID=230839 RepID=A0ACC0WTQ4_9STRA|nr:hypothetical protein PsorP6_002226 [Peronosclerospora sorghi]